MRENDANGRELPRPSLLMLTNQRQLCSLIMKNPDALRAVPELNSEHFTEPALGTVFSALRAVQENGERIELVSIVQQLSEWARETVELNHYDRLVEATEALRECSGGAVMEAAMARHLAINFAGQIMADKVAYDELVCPRLDISNDADLDGLLGDITWEWPGYVPRGFLTMLAGDQEKGKSTVMQALCDARLRGACWPDGEPIERAGDEFKLLWLDTEGSLALFRQRLRDWGMPRGRFILPPDPLQEIALDNPKDWAWLEGVIAKFQPPLVVIDSLSGSHNSNENSNDKDGLKPTLKRLSALARQHQIAIVLIHHLRKAAPGVASYPITLDRLRGAGAITQLCRSVIALSTPDPALPTRCRLDVIKSNLRQKPPGLGYELTGQGPIFGDAPEPPQARRAVDEAMDFLELALAAGPRLADELTQQARAEGIGRNALLDAKKALSVKTQREGGKAGRWFWRRE